MKDSFISYYRLRNYLQSLILLAGMLVLLGMIGWLLMGPAGVVWFLFIGIFILIGATRISPRLMLILHGARVLRPEDSPYLYQIVIKLAKQSGIKDIPTLYYIPSRLINIFTTGLNENVSIAISYGLVRQLNVRELTGVLAHEISHIHGNDLLVMLVADVIARLTTMMAFAGFILLWVYIPLFVLTDEKVPWVLLIVLMMAPTVSTLMQLALSRSREFSADLEAAKLTGDPLSLASALEKIESRRGNWMERMYVQYRRIQLPSLLRTHPLVIDRINRLKDIAIQMYSS